MFSRLRRRARPIVEVLRAEHAVECAQLHADFFAHPWGVNEFEALITSAAVYGAVGVDPSQGDVGGFILVRRAADEAEILTIAVDKSLQKQGLGQELLEHQRDVLRRIGVRRLFLEVDEENRAARRLYEKLAFAQVGIRPDYYRSSQRKPSNALILACDL